MSKNQNQGFKCAESAEGTGREKITNQPYWHQPHWGCNGHTLQAMLALTAP